jgi:pimeloyl-ACP methyl ester carboxylesterase
LAGCAKSVSAIHYLMYELDKLTEVYDNACQIWSINGSGHWIPEEQPGFVIKQLVNFFGANNNDTNK